MKTRFYTSKNRRFTLIAGLFALLFFGIVARLYIVQIQHHEYFSKLAERAYVATVSQENTRGAIRDVNGRILATTRHMRSAFLYRDNITDVEQTERTLEHEFPLVWQEYKNPANTLFWIEHRVSEDRIKELKQILPDIRYIYQPTRFYPKPYMPHVVGFTNTTMTGLSGIEASAQNLLTGTPSIIRVQEDAAASGLSFLHSIVSPGSPGKDIQMSCDQTLSLLTEKELVKAVEASHATRATALIFHPKSGHVKTMIQLPTFNPNEPVKAKHIVRKNDAISRCFEYGSVMRLFLALACASSSQEWSPSLIHGILNNSPGSIDQASRILGDRFYTHLQKCGFSNNTGIELPGERAGYINPPERWSNTSLKKLASGYEIMGTTLQLARAASIFVTGGLLPRPTLSARQKSAQTIHAYSSNEVSHVMEVLKKLSRKNSHVSLQGSSRLLVNGTYSDSERIHTALIMPTDKATGSLAVITLQSTYAKEAQSALNACAEKIQNLLENPLL